ncbi:MAG: hypothetical protein HDT28_01420 [Clostridiales bacterium]|nr:hypothetical protein [Clostridiales bacterium]
MSQKNKLAKEIHALEEEIKALEFKRSRSMAVIMEAMLSQSMPNDTDVQFFRTFNAEIEIKRDQLQKLTKQLENLL